ncbi:unnamed protein product [Adineta ricciae]|uniref:Ubiquitin carboxyl-terminal hydrolase 36 n=1 Tax=Adineta ricciae TaxID=249248 RepID=A0A815RG08_ADIRI|nr:unnamed protein product [Adineta ricciae]CAF1476832.1 unnamed protein product [Adineta ricciae]
MSATGSDNSSPSDDSNDSLNELNELFKFRSPKPPPTAQERRVLEAATSILRYSCGVMCITGRTQIEMDAAELLVDELILVCVENLLKDVDDIDVDGYVKMVPDGMDLTFIGRLLGYNVTWESYLKNITVLDIWRERLSPKGISYLSEMAFYRELLNIPSVEPSNDMHAADHDHGEAEKQFSSNIHNTTFNEKSFNLNACSGEILFDNVCTSTPKRSVACGNSSTKTHVTTTQESISIDNDKTSSITYIRPLMDWNELRRKVVGLNNSDGTSCFINASLQCFASTPPLIEWIFKQKHHLTTCQLSNQGSFCSICQMSSVIYSVSSSSKQNITDQDISVAASADCISKNLKEISPAFITQEQEDANLFITSFLDHCVACYALHMSILSPIKSVFNFIDRIFRITLLNTVKCSSCLNASIKEEYTYTLSVEINNMNSLPDALQHFFEPEILTGDNSYHYGVCNTFVHATKRFTIQDLPPALIINLKRSVGFGSSIRKHTQQVAFDELLTVHPYVTDKLLDSNKENQNHGESNEYLYRLYAVINHISKNNDNGHYHAYLRTYNDIWFFVNDSQCQQVSLEQVLYNKYASIFFYGKTPRAPTNTKHVPTPIPLQCSSIDNSLVATPNISNTPILGSARRTNVCSMMSPTSKQLKDFMRIDLIFCLGTLALCTDKPSIGITLGTIDKSPHQQLNITSNLDIPAGSTESSITIGDQCPKKNIFISFDLSFLIWCLSGPIADVPSSSVQTSASSKRTHMSFTDEWESMNSDTSRIVASVAAGVPLQVVFECTLPRTFQAKLSSTALVNLLQYRQQILNQEHDAKMRKMGLLPVTSISLSQKKQSNNGSNSPSNKRTKRVPSTEGSDQPLARKVNIEYLDIILPYLKRYNPYCGLCVCTRRFGNDLSNPTHYIIKCVLKCNDTDCKFSCRVFVLNNGDLHVSTSHNTVCHDVKRRVARPIRGLKRKELAEKFRSGALVYQVHGQYSEKRTTLEKMGFNYDSTGKSKLIFKKIKAEVVAESLLSPNVTSSILQLHDEFILKVNPDGTLRASIRLYDAIVAHKDSVLSWDATGGVVKNTGSKEILYYELAITHSNIVDEDSLIPLTFMLSESQSLFTVTQWLLSFKDNHKQIFPHKKDSFPRPAIILSDRAQVFLQAALRVFNDENYQQFLSRAYRIVTKKGIQSDFFKTNIHACLAHFMLDMRKRINKYLPDMIREFAMWSIALLVNSNTYEQLKNNWRLICRVFLNYTTNTTPYFAKHYTMLLSRISEITNEPNASKAITQSKEVVTATDDPYEFDEEDFFNDDDEGDELQSDEHIRKRRKIKQSSTSQIINVEKELNEIDSPFKRDLSVIYYECCEESIKMIGKPSSTDKVSKGSRIWLLFINQRCMPTVPIWSNLLLGNLSRHGRESVHAFDALLVSTHDQRTNAISERRMGIVKRTQLGVETRIRADVVLQILIKDMLRLVENFSVSFMASMSQTTNSQNRTRLQLRDVQENWRQSSHRGHGHYCKAPNESVTNSLKNALIVRPANVNVGLIIPTLAVASWFNVGIALLLSIKVFRETLPDPASIVSPHLIEIIDFVKNWMRCLRLIKPPKKTSPEQQQLLRTQFDLPYNMPDDIDRQLVYIVDQILVSLLIPSIRVRMIYTCTSCKFAIEKKNIIRYILIHTMDNQIDLHNHLSNFFVGGTSDRKCDKCGSTISRHMKIIDCPSVIVVKIDHGNGSKETSCKVPETICFNRFLDKSSIGCTSATVFDVVGFATVDSSTENKLISLTKIKERWCVSPQQKLIGNGPMFLKLLAASRIVILERIRTCTSNFLYAVAQCCSITVNVNDRTIKPFKTLRDAIEIIEHDEQFTELRHLLLSSCVTYYACNKYHSSSNLLSSTSEGICIYEQDSDSSEIYGTPLLTSYDESLQ